MIFLNEGKPSIFIHIPKTSGNSLCLHFKDFSANRLRQKSNQMGHNQDIFIYCEKKRRREIKHVSIKYYQDTYPEIINDYFKFTIIRNPYDRILSYYFYRKKGEDKYKFDKTNLRQTASERVF